ncbi:hypothetical protein [Pseudobacteroides cellulosolvens]|uniref:hypothetical protein n=1 Tax=Pseudobacteroides cellulosolvens TaxID=35825 RepID=UPI00056A5B54|nr:hypothetical protein [Pseudobacteroides cellulosolvens]
MNFNRDLWIFNTDIESSMFLKDILIELISRFPLSQSEGIELINYSWKHIDAILKDDIIFHESPEYWASTLYLRVISILILKDFKIIVCYLLTIN